MRLFVTTATVAGAAAGIWYGLLPVFAPQRPLAVIASAMLGGFGGWGVAMVLAGLVAGVVDRFRRVSDGVDRYVAGDDIRSVEEQIAARHEGGDW